MISEWQSSIANADAADWVNVAVNLFAAVMSIWAAKQARIRLAPREELFWRFTAERAGGRSGICKFGCG